MTEEARHLVWNSILNKALSLLNFKQKPLWAQVDYHLSEITNLCKNKKLLEKMDSNVENLSKYFSFNFDEIEQNGIVVDRSDIKDWLSKNELIFGIMCALLTKIPTNLTLVSVSGVIYTYLIKAVDFKRLTTALETTYSIALLPIITIEPYQSEEIKYFVKKSDYLQALQFNTSSPFIIYGSAENPLNKEYGIFLIDMLTKIVGIVKRTAKDTNNGQYQIKIVANSECYLTYKTDDDSFRHLDSKFFNFALSFYIINNESVRPNIIGDFPIRLTDHDRLFKFISDQVKDNYIQEKENPGAL